MSYKAFYNDIKTNQLSALYLLYGSEKLMIDRLIEQLVDSVLEPTMRSFNYIEKSGEALAFDEAMRTVERLPMMDQRLIVVIRAADFINSTDWSDEARRHFIDYHKDKATLTTVLVSDAVDKRKQAYKQIKKVGKVYNFDRLDQKTLAKWIAQEVGRLGKSISAGTTQLLIDKLGYTNKDATIDLYGVLNIVQRICALTKRDQIVAADLDDVIDNSLEANIFKMIDALFEGRAELAYAQFNRLLSNGEVAIKICFMIHRHLRQLQKIDYLSSRNYSASAIETALALKGFVVRKALAQLRRYASDDLRRLLAASIACDLQLKSAVAGNVAVENLMAQILLTAASD